MSNLLGTDSGFGHNSVYVAMDYTIDGKQHTNADQNER